jgi:hypothetical protein
MDLRPPTAQGRASHKGDTAGSAYDNAMTPVQKAYDEATAAASKAYDEAMAPGPQGLP